MQQWNFSVNGSCPAISASISPTPAARARISGRIYNTTNCPTKTWRSQVRQRAIPNPFNGIIAAAQTLGGATTTYGQLLRPYPQFTGVATYGSTSGSFLDQSLEIRAEKRLSHGLNFLVSYMFTKMIDDSVSPQTAWIGNVPGFQDNNDRRAERSVDSQMVPGEALHCGQLRIAVRPTLTRR